jgi:hypothetical protein
MCKRFLFLILTIFIFSIAVDAHAYTVVLKNGKVMTGTLLSETTDSIIFKDDAGIQFSLKKAALDMDKMTAANAQQAPPPAAAPAPAMQQQSVEAPKAPKKGRTYTKEDIDKLKERYGELTVGTPIENVEDYSEGVLKPEAYVRILKESASGMPETLQNLATLGSSVNTSWEVAESTGKNPKQAVTDYLANKSAVDLLSSYNAQMSAYDDAKTRLANPPKGYEDGYKALTSAVASLQNYYQYIRGWSEAGNSSVFKSRLNELSSLASSSIAQLQAWQPPAPAQPPQPPAEQTQTEPTSE